MEPQDTLTQIGAIAGIAAAIWLVARDAIPLVFRSIGSIQEWRKRIRRNRQASCEKKSEELRKREEQRQIEGVRSDFYSAIMRLREMERDGKSYHKTEWKRQINLCKVQTVRIMKACEVEIEQSSLTSGPQIIYYPEESLVVDWRQRKRRLEQLTIDVCWYPRTDVTTEELRFEPEIFAEQELVFRKPLKPDELAQAGWSIPHSWRKSQ